jgi:signal transduction histidine kinase
MRRFGLRQRFILVIFTLFVVLFGAVAAIQVARTAMTERTTLNEQTKSFATLATKPISDVFLMYKDSGTLRIKHQIDDFTALNPDVVGIGVIDTSGNMLFKSGNVGEVTAAQAATFEPLYVPEKGVINQAIIPVVEDNGVHRYAIVYTVSDQRLVENTKRNVELILLLSIIVLVLAIMVTYWLINRFFLSPVRTISTKSLSISKGSFEDQIELHRNDELGDLASAVNTMANSLRLDIAKLREADRLKSEFITISSHNLRTPLMILKGDMEMIQDKGAPDDLKPAIASMAASTAQLGNFIEDLLAISSMESGKLAVSEMKPAPINELLERIKEDYIHRGDQSGISFTTSFDLTDDDIVVMSDHMMKIVLVNLLENAFKFTKEGSVTLKAYTEQSSIVIQVIDTGIGIPQEEVPKLFTKFHRGTSVMRYDYEGTGIGLYLTKLIVDNHHGTITVDSMPGKGATFTVRLPRTQSSPIDTSVPASNNTVNV